MKSIINIEDIKNNNTISAIQYLQKVSNATKKEISLHTDLSITTIAAILKELQSCNLVREYKRDDSTGGRKAMRYELNKEKKVILNVMIDKEYLYFQVMNIYGEIVSSNEIQLEDRQSVKQAIISYIENRIDISEIETIGIGVPGIVKDKQYYNQNLLDNIGEIIESKFNRMVHLVNDLNAIACGYIDQNQKHDDKVIKNLVYVHINNQCSGAGIIVDDKIIDGTNHYAGEIGYLPMDHSVTFDESIKTNSLSKFHESIGKLILMLNCIVNPDLIIIGGNHIMIKQISVALLQNQFAAYHSTFKIPRIKFEAKYMDYYKNGMAQISMDTYLKERR